MKTKWLTYLTSILMIFTLCLSSLHISALDEPTYEASIRYAEDMNSAVITLTLPKNDAWNVESILFPDGTTADPTAETIEFEVDENKNYEFTITYQLNQEGEMPALMPITISVTIDALQGEEPTTEAHEPENDAVNTEPLNDPTQPKTIHIDETNGDDTNDGIIDSVKTMEQALTLTNDGDTILIDSPLHVTTDTTWDLSDQPNTIIQRNSGGAMIIVDSTATLTLRNITLDGTYQGNGTPSIQSIIELGEIGGDQSHGATLILEAGAILQNNDTHNTSGGAILGYSYNTIIMNDKAIIRDNGDPTTGQTCADFGGAISLENHGKFIMNGGTITNNHAIRGGAISLIASSMEMNDGTISHNSANSANKFLGHYGGAIYLSNYQDWSTNQRNGEGEASLIMNGGTITQNQATYASGNDIGLGGAIATYPRFDKQFEKEPKITVTLNNGTISDNSAINGGAISAYFEATKLSLNKCLLTENHAQSQGGALYLVFNAQATVVSSQITNNTAAVGGGIYMTASPLVIHSSTISDNSADSKGGAIMIDKQTWQNQSATCTLYDTIIDANKAAKGNGSDAIYQDGQLQIGQGTQIDANNDVYLPSGRFIEVIAPLSQINTVTPETFNSEDQVIESNTQPGTPLIRYIDGGETAAKAAENGQFYIRSQYMPETLIIGKSEADIQKDFMTYINKPTYTVSYQFVSENGSALPDVILALLPSDDRHYFKDMNVQALMPKKTSVKVNDGTWKFIGYEQPTQTVLDQDITFIGRWQFIDAADQNPNDPKPDHKPDTDDQLDTDSDALPHEDTQSKPKPEIPALDNNEQTPSTPTDEEVSRDDVANTSAVVSYQGTLIALLASLLVLSAFLVKPLTHRKRE